MDFVRDNNSGRDSIIMNNESDHSENKDALSTQSQAKGELATPENSPAVRALREHVEKWYSGASCAGGTTSTDNISINPFEIYG